jgi:hypothetical protein
MRDNHQACPELMATYERDGLYFGVVRVTLPSDSAAFEFGVEQKGYEALKRILQTRPFDQMPGIAYRYFFTGSYGRKLKDAEPVTIAVRVEQGTASKNVDFECPISLISNLKWFFSLTDLNEAAALKRIQI